jgi:diguanylate cyclase (GGDEF)-like protein
VRFGASLYLIYVSQALLACGLAGLLLWCHRLYRRDYLWHWGWSWVAFAVHMWGAALGLWLALRGAGAGPRGLVTTLAFLGGQLQVAWFVLGAAELRGTPIAPRERRRVLFAFGLLGLAVGAVYLGLPAANPARGFLRIGARALASGIAMLAAAWWIRRSPVWPAGVGRRLVGYALLLYAVQELQYVIATLPPLVGLAQLPHIAYLGYADLLVQAAIGAGTVIGLLEEERARVVAASAEIERLSYRDLSTDLPNRRSLLEQLGRAIARAHRTGERLAVAHLDIDRFGVVNEAWSQATGDAVLRVVGDRLRSLLRESDMVARLGGDSFAVLLSGHTSDEQVTTITERMAQRIGQPFVLHEREIHLTASIGVACYPEHGTDPDTLLGNADAAMYRAKEAGRSRTLFFQPTMNVRARERLGLERALRRAIGENQFVLHYQPICDLRDDRIVRFEALLRWQHPERGILAPGQFLPIAEAIGLTDAIDQWVLRTACSDAFRWRAHARGRPPQVSVNLTAHPLQSPDLVARIETVLGDTGLPASALELEITESAAMDHAESTLRALRALKRIGVRLAIDDFGTGYSSLSYLRTFPIDTLKIDRSFVSDLGVYENATTLVAGIAALGQSLGLAVVAEGVETAEQKAILTAHGCTIVQGHLLGMPQAIDRCLELLSVARAAI